MNLKHTEHRVVIRINDQYKNTHTFADGTKIRLERQYNNLNRRETEPVNAFIVSGEDMESDIETLIHHNAVHDSYRIYNYKPLSGEEEASDWKYYAIPEDMCYLYRQGNEWLPLKGWATALRVFRPYQGPIQNMPPNQLKNVLYITKGDYEGNVVHTITHVDYEIIYQDITGREGRKIRLRPNGCERTRHEPEVIVVDHAMTEKVKKGQLLVGLNPSDAKPLNEYV